MRPTYESDIDCQAMKNHKDLNIAQQNTGAIQDGAHELEVSFIMDRYKKTGVLPELIQQDPTYGDFSASPDFLEAHALVEKAWEQFDALDAHIRARFENDPAQFLHFCNDPKNLEEMRTMGLAKPAPEQPAQPIAAQTQPTPPPPPVTAGGKQ